MAVQAVDNVLLKNTSLNEDQLSSLMSLNVEGGTLGEVLHAKEGSTADELVAELCAKMGIAYIKDIPVSEINSDLISNIPINYAKKHEILPFKDEPTKISVLVTNPLNTRILDDLRVIFKKRVVPIMTTKNRLIEAVNRVYEKSTSALKGLDEIEEEDYDLDEPIIDLLDAGEDDAPVIKLVNTLLFRAVKEKASDIHVEPYEKDMVVRYRIDGVLFDIFKPPKKLAERDHVADQSHGQL